MKDLLRHCLNRKVVAALAFVGIAIWALRPDLVRSALPVLVVLVCPLSMVLMMRAMSGDRSEEGNPRTTDERAGSAPDGRIDVLPKRLGVLHAETAMISNELAQLADDEEAHTEQAPTPPEPAEVIDDQGSPANH